MLNVKVFLVAGLLLSVAVGQVEKPRTYPRKVVAGLRSTITSPDIRPLWVVTGLGIVAALPLDDDLQTRRKDLMSNHLARFGDAWGGAWAAITILPGVYLSEMIRGGSREDLTRRLEFTTLSLTAVGLTTYLLKFAVGRERPNGRGHLSFPSGHTSISFGFAEVVRALYGNKAGVVPYSMALITGISRIHDNKHYLSDVVAGAGLGIGLVRGFNMALAPEAGFHISWIALAPGRVSVELRF